jgi:hypothetical protein
MQANADRPYGPVFTQAQWQHALNALDECLQNEVWEAGSIYLDEDRLYAVLHQKGLTRALITMLFDRLIDAGVFWKWSHTIPAEYSQEPGDPFRHLRPEETTRCLITTYDGWYKYLHSQQATAATGPVEAVARSSDGTAAEATTPAESQLLPALLSDEEALSGLPGKQRKLVLALRSGPLAIPAVRKIVYGTEPASISAVEQLKKRTNQSLVAYGLEIKRKSNTLRLERV